MTVEEILAMEDTPIQEFTNEKGNVKVSTRESLRKNVLAAFNRAAATEKWKDLIVRNVNGGISVPLCRDKLSGEIVWAHMELKINAKAPNVDSWSGRTIQRAPDPVIPKLFD